MADSGAANGEHSSGATEREPATVPAETTTIAPESAETAASTVQHSMTEPAANGGDVAEPLDTTAAAQNSAEIAATDAEADAAASTATATTASLTETQTESTSTPETRSRANTETQQATTPKPAARAWVAPRKTLTTASAFFIKKTLDTITASKETKKRAALRDAVSKANAQTQTAAPVSVDTNVIFEALKLACETGSTTLTLSALDCIGKLVAISFFDCPLPPPSMSAPGDDENVVPSQRADAPTKPLIARVIDTVCECFHGETTDDKVQLQIVKALLSAVLDENATLHQTPLLKAIRQVYNIFLLSKSAGTQSIAQGTLEQMIHAVFGRIRLADATADTATPSEEVVAPDVVSTTEAALNGQDDPEPQKVTLDSFARRQSFDQIPDQESEIALSDDEIVVKDAFLIFRSMCKLSTKALAIDSANDLKSHMVRSKLLSLHMISTILNRHITVFTSPKAVIRSSPSSPGIQFMQATKQYLCYALSRNAVSHIPQVFEVSCEIFWRMMSSLRTHLKKEIEVFLTEIYLPILEMKTSTHQQKLTFMNLLARLAHDPRALVELYLNYDCDRTAADNIYERIMIDLTRITATQVNLNATQQQWQDANQNQAERPKLKRDHSRTPSLSIKSVAPKEQEADVLPQDYQLKLLGSRCLIDILKALVEWCEAGIALARQDVDAEDVEWPERASETSTPQPESISATPRRRGQTIAANESLKDDPTQFENLKLRKTAMTDAIKLFNFKPKKGLAALVRHGFLRSTEPADAARFLLYTEGLNKATIGEYLGEGDELNIKTMHEFVNQLDFTELRFVEALRRFLQTFRLPGEAQKIDRFMLKFADRYLQGNPGTFANADTAYVLAYSVIMLNTDAHSSNLGKAKRMTKQEFIKNNSGINDGQDLEPALLEDIYDEIQVNEIVLKEEQDAALISGTANATGQGFTANLSQALATVGRDLQREAYVAASQEMANKSEARFKNLLRAQKRGATRLGQASVYYNASHFEHVGPMFEVVWMPILASLSGPLQNADDMDTIHQCLEGFRYAIRIACLFDIELARNAFVRTLSWFTSLHSLKEMRLKNLLGVKTLLAVALSEGNELKDSWREVLTAVSQLERLQLISGGIEEDSVPEINRIQNRTSSDSRPSFQSSRNTLRRDSPYASMIAEEAKSREITVAMDRIFTNSAHLSGSAIVHFVRALSAVSSEEIQSSAHTDSPRLYSLQKVVEISYYNMKRIRFEWSNIWAVLGDHFNQVGCNANMSVSFFALDALRQLASRFLEIDELPNFKFQKDFLRPFEYILAHNPAISVKDMVLQCLIQMIKARAENIKSGWQTMLSTFTYAAQEPYEPIVNTTFENVRIITKERMDVILAQGSFPNFVSCLTVLAKNQRFQRTSLQALDLLRSTQRAVLHSHEEGSLVRFWFPILYGFHDILMSGEDMEVRSRALQYLFEALTEYGDTFTTEFWDIVCRQLLFPIFFVLKSDKDGPKLSNVEDLTIWLSSTLVEALRSLINLYTRFFDRLERMLGGYLDLLSSCICQENDTLARIGSACLQQLVIENAAKFTPEHWRQITATFASLFKITTAHQLFDQAQAIETDSAAREIGNSVFEATGASTLADTASLVDGVSVNGLQTAPSTAGSATPQPPPAAVPASRKREFNALIVKCVLQLLMIEAVAELLTKNGAVYAAIPTPEVLQLLSLLRGSWTFASRFNADRDLRVALWRMGFMKQMPNLLRQEVASAQAYLRVLMTLYADGKLDDAQARQLLVPACDEVLGDFTKLDPDGQHRTVVAWRPVVCDLYRNAATVWSVDAFKRWLEVFYHHAVDILQSEAIASATGAGGSVDAAVAADLRRCLALFFKRVGDDVIALKAANGSA